MGRCYLSFLTLLVGLCAVPAVGLAQPTAADWEKQAKIHIDAKRFGQAIEPLRHAAALSKSARIRCNLGYVYYATNQPILAYAFLSQCVASNPNAAKGVHTGISRLDAWFRDAKRANKYGKVRLTVSPLDAEVSLSFLGKAPPLHGSHTVWAPVGTHTIAVRAPGYQPKTVSVAVSPGATTAQGITLEAIPKPTPRRDPDAKPASPRPVTTVTARPAPAAQPAAAPLTDAPASRSSRTPMWISFGTGTAALTAAIILNVRAVSIADDIDPNGPKNVYDDEKARAMRYIWSARGAYALSGIAAGVGTYLWWKRRSKRRDTRVGATVGPRRGLVWAAWDL